MKLSGKVALVTGASRGIGRGIAEALGAEGASVAINYRSGGAAAEEVVASIRSFGQEAIVIQADVADEGDVTRMVDTALGEFGRIDVLVCNASILTQSHLVDMPKLVHYSAAKAALIGMTRAPAREVAPRVTVNALAPGPIETDMLANITPEWKTMKLAELPLARFGRVGDVVPTAVFLASDDAAYYTGQVLGPNGGDVMP